MVATGAGFCAAKCARSAQSFSYDDNCVATADCASSNTGKTAGDGGATGDAVGAAVGRDVADEEI